jgi:hypothetical protein
MGQGHPRTETDEEYFSNISNDPYYLNSNFLCCYILVSFISKKMSYSVSIALAEPGPLIEGAGIGMVYSFL